MTKKRRPLTNKSRFEIFKRDSFTCQYCGEKSPDVILHVDHIKPVAKSGDNEITNLITSCQKCNSGKSARELDDKTVIEKQRKQLEELNERRNQLEMMLQWREGLDNLAETELDRIAGIITDKFTRYILNQSGKKRLKAWIKKYSISEILESADICADQYLKYENNEVTSESWDKAFNYIPKVCAGRRKEDDNPELKTFFYIRGILNNRLHYINPRLCIQLMQEAFDEGVPLEEMQEIATQVRNWSQFTASLAESKEFYKGENASA